jgi:hypothetical protein
MISLRLSEAEFEFLKTRHQNYGARNVSDLARLAVQRMMQASDDPGDDMAAKVAELEGRISTLEAQMTLR